MSQNARKRHKYNHQARPPGGEISPETLIFHQALALNGNNKHKMRTTNKRALITGGSQSLERNIVRPSQKKIRRSDYLSLQPFGSGKNSRGMVTSDNKEINSRITSMTALGLIGLPARRYRWCLYLLYTEDFY